MITKLVSLLSIKFKSSTTTRSLLKAATFTPKSLKAPSAWVGHLPFAAWLIEQIAPKIFVELGTHSGNSYFSFCQSVKSSGILTKCYAVDTWEGDEHAGKYCSEIYDQVSSYNSANYSEFSSLLRMRFDDALKYFSDGSIDLLHIDGLHTYEAVKHDYESWAPKLAPGAIILFHDTNVYERNFGVWKLWKELQSKHPNNIEFFHSHGLGLLQLNNPPKQKLWSWINPKSIDKELLIDYFSALGANQLAYWTIIELNQALSDRDVEIKSILEGRST